MTCTSLNSLQSMNHEYSCKKRGGGGVGVKTVVGSETSLVSGISMAKRNHLPWKWGQNLPCFWLYSFMPSTFSSNNIYSSLRSTFDSLDGFLHLLIFNQ